MTDRNWTMALNWARIIGEVESVTGLTPSQQEIESALDMVENETSVDNLYTIEAEEVEQMIITRLFKIIRKNRGKDIRKKKVETPPSNPNDAKLPNNVDVQFFSPFGTGSLKDLKDMGFDIDPEMLQSMTKSIMENMFKKKKKEKTDDDKEDSGSDEDDDRSASFYT